MVRFVKKMKKVISPDRIKIVSAFLLLASLMLPFSSCSRKLDEDGVSTYISEKPVARVVTEYYYPLEKFDPKDYSSWFFIYSFLWPIPVLILRYRSKGKRFKQILWVSEPFFILGAFYFFYFEAFFEDFALGGYIAFTANGTYGLTWLSEATINIMRFIKRKRRNPTPHS